MIIVTDDFLANKQNHEATTETMPSLELIPTISLVTSSSKSSLCSALKEDSILGVSLLSTESESSAAVSATSACDHGLRATNAGAGECLRECGQVSRVSAAAHDIKHVVMHAPGEREEQSSSGQV